MSKNLYVKDSVHIFTDFISNEYEQCWNESEVL
jgi:hypothetical protein